MTLDDSAFEGVSDELVTFAENFADFCGSEPFLVIGYEHVKVLVVIVMMSIFIHYAIVYVVICNNKIHY